MLRRILELTGVSAVVLLLAACQPLADHPLVDPHEADRDTRLYGTWITGPAKDDDNQTYGLLMIGPATLPLTVGAAEPEKGLMQAWYFQQSQKTAEIGNPLGFFFVSSPSGSTWIASISEGLDFSIGTSTRDNAPNTKRITDTDKKFWFLRYELHDDSLQIWGVPKLTVIDEAIRAGKLHGTVERNEKGEPTQIHLVDGTEALKTYFDENWQQLYPDQPVLTYKRLAVPAAH
jgi:hypothetical protein